MRPTSRAEISPRARYAMRGAQSRGNRAGVPARLCGGRFAADTHDHCTHRSCPLVCPLMNGPTIWYMRRSLSEPFAAPAWPEGTSLARFDRKHAASIHALLVASYARGGGSVEAYEPWLHGLTGDQEFEAASCFLAFQEGELAGVALCWDTGFVKDLCVAEGRRHAGLGSALLAQAFRYFHEAGRSAVTLKVHADNPSGALRLYERLGFRRVPERD